MGNGIDDDCDGAVDEEVPNGIGEYSLTNCILGNNFHTFLSSADFILN